MKNAAITAGLILALIVSLTVFISVMTGGCGQDWFPSCKDPKHPCPNVQPDYPPESPLSAPRDAGVRLPGITDASDMWFWDASVAVTSYAMYEAGVETISISSEADCDGGVRSQDGWCVRVHGGRLYFR